MVSTQSLNSSGDPFGDGNGGAGVAGPPSPEDSISPGIHNDTQLHHYRANNAHPGVNTGNNDAVNVGQTRSVARSIARTALSGTEAPPPAYTSPTVLRVNVLQSLHQLPYENPRPAAAAPSTVESDTIPTRASSSVGGAFVNADSGLSQWARENRSYVTEKLEMKLDAAGYVPSDDPDNITEEEWKCEWGVTKLELTRMRALYARTQA
ncbi:hypothetical protein FRC17_004489 [Serendipita sp. 399]|nr:hypothetical protein FRC17_004489 [Serendipita sp. 399]